MAFHCHNDHPIRGPRDLLPNGDCRECDRQYQARYRTRRGQAMRLMRGLEAAGIDCTDIDERADEVAAAILGK